MATRVVLNGGMCDCPVDLVHSIECTDGTLLVYPLDDYERPSDLAERHADAVNAHGGLRWHSIGCPKCGRVYFHLEHDHE